MQTPRFVLDEAASKETCRSPSALRAAAAGLLMTQMRPFADPRVVVATLAALERAVHDL